MNTKSGDSLIQCQYFCWKLFARDGVHYVDGRGNRPGVGKHSLGTRNREEALKNLTELDHAMAVKLGLAKPQVVSSVENLGIVEGWERYLAYRGRPEVMGGAGPSTLKRYRPVRAYHQEFCREQQLPSWTNITKKSVEDYGRWRSLQVASDATLYLELTLLASVVKWLVEEEKVLPASHRFRLSLRRSHESDTYCYSAEEVGAMIDLCRNTRGLEWLADVILALAMTGLRIAELCGLRWSDIDRQCTFITLTDNRHSARRKNSGALRTVKNRRGRQVPIHPELRRVLEGMARHPDGRVFHGPRGGHAKPDTIRITIINEAIAKLKEKFPTPAGQNGFEHGRVHSFRHFFVSQAFLGGASEGEIRQWVGHADSRIVERYRHLRNEDSQRKMAGIDFLNKTSKHEKPT